MNEQFDVCIIGAGVIGLAIAEKLSTSYKNILLVDKESSFGQHVSSRNSEVIHSGFYYPPNSLKAKLCIEGNSLIYDFAKKYSLNYNKCGKLIVDNSNNISKLVKLKNNAENNGLKGLKLLNESESKNIEPRVKCKNSLWIPSTGIIDSHGLMSKLENISITRDVSIVYNTSVSSIIKKTSNYHLSFNNQSSDISSKIIINCAGLWSGEISSMLGINKYEIEYYKGDYYKSKTLRDLKCLIYPMPSIESLGIHTVMNLNGEVSFGPNIYKVNNIDYKIDNRYKSEYLSIIKNYINIESDDLFEDFSGIRPKIKFDGFFNDFVIKNESDAGCPNFINLIGIDSPGLTSCLSIAKYVESIIV